MDALVTYLTALSQGIRPYLPEIGLSMTATLLVIYGNDLTQFVKKQIGSLKFFMRVTLFIIFCAFGFALLTSYLTPLIMGWLAQVEDLWLFLAVLAAYYGLGYLAHRKGMI